jgi:hypothetical protein
MKSKIKLLGIIALTTVIALAMIACDDDEPKKVVDNSKYYLKPPTGIVATKLSTERLHLTWNEVSGARDYEISVRTNLDSADTRLYLIITSDTRYEHTYYNWYYGYYSRPEQVTTIYYYLKARPREAGYIASDWSDPVPVQVR